MCPETGRNWDTPSLYVCPPQVESQSSEVSNRILAAAHLFGIYFGMLSPPVDIFMCCLCFTSFSFTADIFYAEQSK